MPRFISVHLPLAGMLLVGMLSSGAGVAQQPADQMHNPLTPSQTLPALGTSVDIWQLFQEAELEDPDRKSVV